jgi:lipoic acid synthetase
MILKTAGRPEWLDKKIDFKKCKELDSLFNKLRLNTVCREAFCPNISECFNEGVATFLILGKRCTRGCSFCAVRKGSGQDVDPEEPEKIAEAVRTLKLRHVVITSVTRDDLEDGGASAFINTIKKIKDIREDIAVEVLVPDFKGDIESVRKIIDANPDIFAHNLETVPRIYPEARQGADYKRSLNVLRAAKEFDGSSYTKSGIMLGLGETGEEALEVLRDLREAQCDFLSIGQYLSPTTRHFSVKEYVAPEKFTFYKREAEELGFLSVESAPYVRSSYLAHRYIKNRYR